MRCNVPGYKIPQNKQNANESLCPKTLCFIGTKSKEDNTSELNSGVVMQPGVATSGALRSRNGSISANVLPTDILIGYGFLTRTIIQKISLSSRTWRE